MFSWVFCAGGGVGPVITVGPGPRSILSQPVINRKQKIRKIADTDLHCMVHLENCQGFNGLLGPCQDINFSLILETIGS
jgi:hypothetical protein